MSERKEREKRRETEGAGTGEQHEGLCGIWGSVRKRNKPPQRTFAFVHILMVIIKKNNNCTVGHHSILYCMTQTHDTLINLIIYLLFLRFINFFIYLTVY